MKKYILPLFIVLCLIAYIVGYTTTTTTTNLLLVKPAAEDETVDFYDTVNDNMDLIDAAFTDPLAYNTTSVIGDLSDVDLTGIANEKILKYNSTSGNWEIGTDEGGAAGAVDTSGTPVANDIARFTDADTIEGRSYAELKGDLDLEIGTDVAAAGANSDITSLTGLTTPLAANYGGTGVANNAASTLTISGNFATTLTVSDVTALTLPTSGTVLTNAINTIDSDQYVDASIDHEHLAPDVISGLTDVTSADLDYMMIWDATDSALKKVDMAEVRGAGGGASQLSDLSDVNTSTPTNKFVLVADGVDFESRQLTSDDLSDVASIAMLDEAEDITGAWTLSTGSIEGVDATEFGYLDGVTSDIQTQLGTKLEDITGESILDLVDTPLAFDNGKFLKSTADGTVWDTPAGAGDALTTDGLDQFAATTSAELAGVISDETGSGALNFGPPGYASSAKGYKLASDQTITTGTVTKVVLEEEEFDELGEFDNVTNYRFTAQATGYYLFIGSCYYYPAVDQKYYQTIVYKNGTSLQLMQINASGTVGALGQTTGVAYLEVDDYLELWTKQGSGTNAILKKSQSLTLLTVKRLY